MYSSYVLYGKKLLLLLILLMLALNPYVLNLKADTNREDATIYIEPEFTDTMLTPGENFTISIETDYNGTDIQGWQFTLTYNPLVLNGTSVTNGDLITKQKHPTATFLTTGFDNTEGKLGLTAAVFVDTNPGDGVDVTSGPGTLANITFTVIGYGRTDLVFGRGNSETILAGWNVTKPPPDAEGEPYFIIDAETMPDQVLDGEFINVQPIHDVAVVDLAALSEVIVEQFAYINVTVVNEGNYTESGNVTVYYNTTEIETKPFTLNRGEFKIVSFNWNTSGVGPGPYTLNATAMIPVDQDPSDNTKTASIELKLAPDVVVKDIVAPSHPVYEGFVAAIGELIPINVTVANEGSFDESVNVTLLYDNTFINSRVRDLSPGESEIVEFNWNTSGFAPGSYTLNATAMIPVDQDPSDNTKTASIELKLGYDVAVMGLLVPYKVVAGENASITVVIENKGVYNVTDFDVAVTYDTGLIGTQLVSLLAAGEDISLSFSWNTIDVDSGSYNITAEATLTTDEDPDNNQNPTPKTIDIIVPPVASFTFSPTEPVVDETVTFDASASADPDGTIVSYSWDFGDDTTEVYEDENLTATTTHTYTAAGTYAVTLTVTDNDDLNYTATTDVTVILHDIAITNVTASPSTVKIGELVSINVTVVNEGTENETFNVTVYYNNTVIGAQFITELASGASQLLTFSWNTSDVSAGTYTIKALATPVTDETDTNDNTFTDVIVTIETSTSQDILIYVAAAAGVTAIIIVAVAIYLLKIRKST